MLPIITLGLGGFLGAVLRYSVSNAIQNLAPASGFPYGTFIVNLLGCFLIGVISQVMESKAVVDPQMRLFIMVGTLGAFTTFSTFSLETISLLQQNEVWKASLNILGSNILGLALVLLGKFSVQFLWK